MGELARHKVQQIFAGSVLTPSPPAPPRPPPPLSLADVHGVEWLPFWAFRSIDEVDVAVMWRNFDSVWLAPRATRRYLWVHDPLALASDQVLFSSFPVYGVEEEWVPALSRSLLQKSPVPYKRALFLKFLRSLLQKSPFK